MSTSQIKIKTETETETVVPIESNTRVKLSSKNSKCMVFGFWFSEYLHSNNIVSDDIRDAIFKQLCLFSTPEQQNAFYDSFMENMNATQKSMKKFISCNKTKARKTQKKKVVEQPELVETLVSLANTTEVQSVVQEPPVITKEKRTYNRKPKDSLQTVLPPALEETLPESTQSLDSVVEESPPPLEQPPVITKQKRIYNRKPKASLQTIVAPVIETTIPLLHSVGEETITPLLEQPPVITKQKRPYNRKPTVSDKPSLEPIVQPTMEEPLLETALNKEKRKYSKKKDIVISMTDTDSLPTPLNQEKVEEKEEEYQHDSDSEEESINTHELFIDGKKWFVSVSNHEVYDPANIDDPVPIGLFDPINLSIRFY